MAKKALLRDSEIKQATPGASGPPGRNRVPSSAATRRDRAAFAELRSALRAFAAERDWDRFHSPKNLAMALAVEASELMEHFQWLSETQSQSLDRPTKEAVAEELADVLLYLVRLADRLDIDLLEAARAKLVLNARKYPVEKARGSNRKYTEL